ncbi:MAG TPA: radical SAM family heme chaperone HemW [Candidatus Omnitrophota bacterium]|nr:radical SAM family heme chaperone HemW [Candidatus Omnitrophota bacterium]
MDKGLYIHIPFCGSKCHYCNFISVPNPDPEIRSRFFRCLFSEINRAQRQYGTLEFDTLYLGGGTPSLLTTDEMAGLLEKIREHFKFRPDAEVTCEWNPGDRRLPGGEDDPARAKTFSSLGINRISLGAQTFDDSLLARLGRRHTSRDTILTIERIRNAGLSNISLDLMLRIPGQTAEDFQKSIEKAVELGVSQISLYDLEIHAGTVFGRLDRDKKLDLPDERVHAAMYELACHRLPNAGYQHYEISNFAKPPSERHPEGFFSRHNLVYWRNGEYLGLGPGAFSYLSGVRRQFARDLERYLRKCESEDWTNDVEDVLTNEEKEIESLAMRLRLAEGVNPADFPLANSRVSRNLEELLQEGFLKREGMKIRLTPRGQFLSEDVFGFLLRKDDAGNCQAL